MLIPIEDIIEFHKIRTQCHINCMNYFAELLGYHFPEHDNDKNHDPIRIGYAYHNYAKYHGAHETPAQLAAFRKSNREHHKTQPHHIEYYQNVFDIPDIVLIEMVCDWFSANFEQNHITCDGGYPDIQTYFDMALSHLPWTGAQRTLINKLIRELEQKSVYKDIVKHWAPVL